MRIGIIGLKGHHSYVLEGARELGDCEIVAVSDADEQAVQNFKRREPLASRAETYHDWHHLAEHTLMDICVVADENGQRANQLIDLAQRGVHIVAEKPLATTLEDLRRVRAAFQASKSRLTMLLTMRHDAKYVTMRNLIQQGVVGQVRQVTCQKSYRLGARPEWQKHRDRLGGTIPYIGIHALDLMWWVSSLEFKALAAFHGAGARAEMNETEDTASILVSYAGGASGTARLDYLRPEPAPSHGDDRLRIAGTEGVIEIVYPNHEPVLITSTAEPMRVEIEPTEHLLSDFVRSMKDGKPSRIPAEDCYYITEVVLRAREAADDRTMIEL
jgi:predicted dehydrogenase